MERLWRNREPIPYAIFVDALLRLQLMNRQRPAVTGSQGPLGADAGPELSDDGAKN